MRDFKWENVILKDEIKLQSIITTRRTIDRSHREQIKVARLLLEKGASVSHKNKQGQTALFQELNTSIWSLTFILRIAYQDIDLFAQRDKKTGEVVLTLQLQLKRAKSRQKRKRP